ncbi:MAG: DotH/IcmK family type IV secretion protein [Pseudomonadota bacterium]|nr:DotH/IcmK family type IV secretion protein [Pseudomonadota bacterium]
MTFVYRFALALVLIGIVCAASFSAIAQQPPVTDPKIRNQAFDTAISSLLPLKPEEIAKLVGHLNDVQQAAAVPPGDPPKPMVKVETVSLDPGASPPLIRVSPGYVSAVSFLDASGAPWPIRDIAVGGQYNIPQPEEGANMIRITPLNRFGRGNMSVRLAGLNTPLSFVIETGLDVAYFRYDARIPQMGPSAATPLIDRAPSVAIGNDALMAFLEGVPPTSARRLSVNGVDGRTTAYTLGEKMYVRTPLTLLSPGWNSHVSSADGMRVYEVTEAPVLLLADGGHMVRASILTDIEDSHD